MTKLTVNEIIKDVKENYPLDRTRFCFIPIDRVKILVEEIEILRETNWALERELCDLQYKLVWYAGDDE